MEMGVVRVCADPLARFMIFVQKDVMPITCLLKCLVILASFAGTTLPIDSNGVSS
jgi:hypothetical protein